MLRKIVQHLCVLVLFPSSDLQGLGTERHNNVNILNTLKETRKTTEQ